MNKENKYAEKALQLTTLLTLLVAGYEVARACGSYKTGMNFLDIASYATADLNTYCIVLILANLILLPSAVLLYKQSGRSLKDEIQREWLSCGKCIRKISSFQKNVSNDLR